MRVQSINNKQSHRQNFGALVIKGDIAAQDTKLILGLGELLDVKLVGGTNKQGKDVLILDSISKSKEENKLHYLIKNMFGNKNVRRHMDSSVEKMKAAYLKKHPDGLQIEEPIEAPVNNVIKRQREIV